MIKSIFPRKMCWVSSTGESTLLLPQLPKCPQPIKLSTINYSYFFPLLHKFLFELISATKHMVICRRCFHILCKVVSITCVKMLHEEVISTTCLRSCFHGLCRNIFPRLVHKCYTKLSPKKKSTKKFLEKIMSRSVIENFLDCCYFGKV